MKIFLLVIVFCLISSSGFTQDTISQYYFLNIITNISGAEVIVDSINAGFTPLSNYKAIKGYHNIKIINLTDQGINRWENENILLNNFELISDTTIIKSFRNFYLINSDPYNASVFSNDTLLGYTPYRFFDDISLNRKLNIRKSGYSSASVMLFDYPDRHINVKLLPDGSRLNESGIFKDKNTSFAKKRNVPLIAGLGAATLGSAFATINLKNKANNFYDNYLINLNQADLNNANRYDVYSLISLIFTQAALGTLIYFLFFD
ncbi:hypothetical protein BH10BAC5_BH10BAC5_19110 [soil metagenome]